MGTIHKDEPYSYKMKRILETHKPKDGEDVSHTERFAGGGWIIQAQTDEITRAVASEFPDLTGDSVIDTLIDIVVSSRTVFKQNEFGFGRYKKPDMLSKEDNIGANLSDFAINKIKDKLNIGDDEALQKLLDIVKVIDDKIVELGIDKHYKGAER